MGILNVTPDSFSDGGKFVSRDKALVQTEAMIAAGADIIDIGGESTRPGSEGISDQQELDRVIPVIEAISQRFDIIISLDTSKSVVMQEGAARGAGMLNDVRALQAPGALDIAAAAGLSVCLMHVKGNPKTMQASPQYDNVVTEVNEFLAQRLQACVNAGIESGQIVIDPGFGFGKNLQHNLQLLRQLHTLTEQAPVLTGLSRKRMFAEILGDPEVSREAASVTGALLCVQQGASIVRVHDVQPTVDALKVYQAFAVA